ncbi:DUF2971 domain-containing protein [Candidatus Stoquefichus massiliensis]|uniref:DUF2971 domain-containing protein n=1 Tax=Candidatus Stoquefichus massiliensis TaxID=1470350 RepID=UPI000486E7A7|nr:DUF2971 domain-containing protein [Candidatus Stoquefichus massiliensis]
MKELINEWKKYHTLLIGKEDIYSVEFNNCFHYTSLDVFWLIAENETMRATNVMFSNDSEEHKAGKKIVQSFTDIENDISSHSSNYMICFCEQENLLSQWREYANKGVCIEFDFTRDNIFKILSVKEDIDSLYSYSEPTKILYVDYVISNNIVKFDVNNLQNMTITNSSLQNINCNDLKESLNQYINKNQYVTKEYNRKMVSRTLIPYIKHSGFLEEKEKRLVFTLTSLQEINHVCFEKDLSTHIKKPYINVKCENKDNDIFCDKVEIGKSLPKVLQANIIKKIEEYSNKINFHVEHEIIEGENIYISIGKNQEELFWGIEELLMDFKSEKRYKVWCHGHWPIRSIMVAPSQEQDIIMESIEKYVQKIYWLKNIDIKKSTTPYRTKK